MEDAMGDVVVFDQVEDLCLVDITRIGQGMQDPIRIQRKILPVSHFDFVVLFSSPGQGTLAGP